MCTFNMKNTHKNVQNCTKLYINSETWNFQSTKIQKKYKFQRVINEYYFILACMEGKQLGVAYVSYSMQVNKRCD